jgi:hypothetical protein
MGTKSLALPCTILLFLLAACDSGIGPPPLRVPTSTVDIQPITAPYRPFRVIQVCLDTPPLYPVSLFTQAVNKIADWIEADVTVNQGGFVVYVGEIRSRSFEANVLDPIQVPAIPADPVQPMSLPTLTPVSGQNGYQYVDEQATRDATNSQLHENWQHGVISNHAMVAAALASVKEKTQQLRALKPVFDDKGADVYGCLASAAENFANTKGEHSLIIASAFVNNTDVNKATINLAQVHVRGIYRYCAQASAQVCIDQDAFWKQTFIQLGAAQDVAFYYPQPSDTLGPLF